MVTTYYCLYLNVYICKKKKKKKGGVSYRGHRYPWVITREE